MRVPVHFIRATYDFLSNYETQNENAPAVSAEEVANTPK